MLSKKEQKFIKSLKIKKYRSREKCFLVEGTKNVRELLNSDFEIHLVVGTDAYFSNERINTKVRTETVSSELLTQLSTLKTNHDVLAVAKMKSFDLESITSKDHLFVLDGVSDPGNVGTIIRTLDWFGFDQLVCSENCAEFYHPKVISSTMGSFTRMRVVYTNLLKFLDKQKRPIYIADMNGKDLSQNEINEPGIFVMGSESHGVSEQIKSEADHTITIPKFGHAESLNVAIATGILAAHLRMSK